MQLSDFPSLAVVDPESDPGGEKAHCAGSQHVEPNLVEIGRDQSGYAERNPTPHVHRASFHLCPFMFRGRENSTYVYVLGPGDAGAWVYLVRIPTWSLVW